MILQNTRRKKRLVRLERRMRLARCVCIHDEIFMEERDAAFLLPELHRVFQTRWKKNT